jgi:hypothetical protein
MDCVSPEDIPMHRWNLRALALMIGCAALPAGVRADEPAPSPKPVTPPAAVQVTPPVAVPVTPPVSTPELFRAATPYNATYINRAVPNPLYNRPNFTLPCDNRNQNFASFVPAQPECMKNLFGGRGDCDSGGCGGCGKHGKGKHGDCGCGSGAGSCATCGNTKNFIWGSSRSYFGESSREFFERPPSVDGIRHPLNPIPVSNRTEK